MGVEEERMVDRQNGRFTERMRERRKEETLYSVREIKEGGNEQHFHRNSTANEVRLYEATSLILTNGLHQNVMIYI